MNLTSLKRAIGQIKDSGEVCQIIRYATERRNLLFKREYEARCEAAFERVKNLPQGTKVYCNMTGISLGDSIQRGDEGIVFAVRRRRLYLTIGQRRYWFAPSGIERYNWQTTPPETKFGGNREQMRNLGEALGKIDGAIQKAGLR